MSRNCLIMALVATFVVGTASSASAMQAPERSIVNVTGDLYRAQDNAHFTVFLVTSEGIILSDPINTAFSEWVKAELDDRFGVPVRYVLYSHSDFDHASGGAVFADTAEFVAHENMRDATLGAEVHQATTFYSDRYAVALGGKSVEMIHPGPAHSDNMSVVYFPAEDALFVVDFISLKRLPFQNLAGYEHELMLSEMRTVEALGAAIVIPGHGDIGTTADVRDHRHYLEELHDAVAEGIAAGESLAELQASVLMEDYRDWGAYADWRTLNVEGMYNFLMQE